VPKSAGRIPRLMPGPIGHSFEEQGSISEAASPGKQSAINLEFLGPISNKAIGSAQVAHVASEREQSAKRPNRQMPPEHPIILKDEQGSATVGLELHRLRLVSQGNAEQERGDEEPSGPGDFEAEQNGGTDCPP